ncbi:hypothetical protein CLF_109620, partial [Clonorchis sinensis]
VLPDCCLQNSPVFFGNAPPEISRETAAYRSARLVQTQRISKAFVPKTNELGNRSCPKVHNLNVAVDLFAELGNWLENVSSPYEETSSVRSWPQPNYLINWKARMMTVHQHELATGLPVIACIDAQCAKTTIDGGVATGRRSIKQQEPNRVSSPLNNLEYSSTTGCTDGTSREGRNITPTKSRIFFRNTASPRFYVGDEQPAIGA